MNKNIENADWWRLTKKDNTFETIEWTYQYGGWVRAKLDSVANWEYKQCSEACHAISFGNRIIQEQMGKR